MGLDDVWDAICDGFDYFIHFEWVSDFWEAITELFESIGEFSIWGLIFGLGSAFLVFALRKYMLDPFLKGTGFASYWFWAIITLVSCFIVGYLIGKHFSDTA